MTASKATILVLEDDDFISTYLVAKLKEDFNALVATNTKEARQILKSQPIQLIVLDVLLPEEDGFSFLQRLQEENSPYRKIPVIILSNLSQPEHIDRGLTLGAVEYLVKANYTPDEIADRVKATLETSQQ